MIKITLLPIVALLTGGFFATPSFADWESPRTTTTVSIPQQPSTTDEEADPLLDAAPGIITNEQEGELGMIRDFILDLQAGRIVYAVGSFDQLKNQKGKLFVIPWGVVKADPEMPVFTLLRNAALLENAPSFPSAKWPNLRSWEWTATVDTYWQKTGGAPRSTVSASNTLLCKASDLLGLKIKSETGKELGTVEQLLMDTETGAIAHVILSSKNKSKENQVTFFSLPWSSIMVNPGQHIFLADIDKEKMTKTHTPAHSNAPSIHPNGISTSRKTPQQHSR
jgi:sporulation protein YlmC with PRC-barrel domain